MRGQIFTIDLMVSLVVLTLALGLVVLAWDAHLQQMTSTTQQAKMQQIAIDAAALEYYADGNATLLTNGVGSLGYTLRYSDDPTMVCVSSVRGSSTKRVEVFLCSAE